MSREKPKITLLTGRLSMKRAGIICAVVLSMLAFSLWHYELYADHCNTEQPPQEQPPAEEAPAEQAAPVDSPSGSSGPTAPKVVVDESTRKSRIPEIPPYGPKGGPFINEDGSVGKPPKSGPMVSDKTMDGIRKTPRRDVIVDHIGDGTIIVEQSQEDCCARAEAELNICYTTESLEAYNQCVDEFGPSPGGSFGSYLDAYSGGSDAIDIYCTGKRSEFQTQCIERFYGKCNRKCKLPLSIKTAIRREIIEFQYGPGSTGGGGAGGKHGYKVKTDHLPH